MADLQLLLAAAEEAGRIALHHRSQDSLDVVEKPGGQGPVTAADLAIDAMLRETLLDARPDYGWLSEETADTADRLSRERCFIVDPIDGTRAYIANGRGFCHALAIAERGQVIAAVAHFPALGRTYWASAGQGAFRDGAPICVAEPSDESPPLLITRAMQSPHHWPSGVPPHVRAYRPSLVARLCYTAEGRFMGSVTFRPTWEWDVATGVLILTEAGATVSDGAGGPIAFNQRDPRLDGLIAAAPGYHATLLAHRKPAV